MEAILALIIIIVAFLIMLGGFKIAKKFINFLLGLAFIFICVYLFFSGV